jgi:hypothetical protein
MGIKLVFDGGLPLCDLPIGVYRKLCTTAFTNSQYGEIGEPLDDSQLALHKHQFPTVPKPLTSPVDFKYHHCPAVPSSSPRESSIWCYEPVSA